MERSKSDSAVRSGPGRQMLRRCVVLAAVFGIGACALLRDLRRAARYTMRT